MDAEGDSRFTIVPITPNKLVHRVFNRKDELAGTSREKANYGSVVSL